MEVIEMQSVWVRKSVLRLDMWGPPCSAEPFASMSGSQLNRIDDGKEWRRFPSRACLSVSLSVTRFRSSGGPGRGDGAMAGRVLVHGAGGWNRLGYCQGVAG